VIGKSVRRVFGDDLGVSFGYHAAGKVSAYVAYDANLRDHFTAQTASVGARISF
jgi:hypothetical protein